MNINKNKVLAFKSIFNAWHSQYLSTNTDIDTKLIKKLMKGSLTELNELIFIGCEIVRITKNTKYEYTPQKNRTKLQLIAMLLSLFEKNTNIYLTKIETYINILLKGE